MLYYVVFAGLQYSLLSGPPGKILQLQLQLRDYVNGARLHMFEITQSLKHSFKQWIQVSTFIKINFNMPSQCSITSEMMIVAYMNDILHRKKNLVHIQSKQPESS